MSWEETREDGVLQLVRGCSLRTKSAFGSMDSVEVKYLSSGWLH